MRFVQTEVPSEEPVTLAEAKEHARIESSVTADDSLITGLIVAARDYTEAYTKRFLISQDWSVYFDLTENPTKELFICPGRGKIISVAQIVSFDEVGNLNVFDSSNYFISGDRVVLENSAAWPTLVRDFDALQIDLTFGFGTTASDVPQDIKQAILMMVAHWYENREATGDPIHGKDKRGQVPFGVTAILQKYRIFQV